MIAFLVRLFCRHDYQIKHVKNGVLGLECWNCQRWQPAQLQRTWDEIRASARTK